MAAQGFAAGKVQQTHEMHHQDGLVVGTYEVAQPTDNLNYQSLENGQQMLQFAEQHVPNNQFHQRYGGGGRLPKKFDNDQIADYIGVDDLVDQDEFDDPEHFNPKSKTTNMSSILKQINKS